MKCPSCSIFQHSCHVDGNMKLYRFKTSRRFVFTVYRGVLLKLWQNADFHDVDYKYAMSINSYQFSEHFFPVICGSNSTFNQGP